MSAGIMGDLAAARARRLSTIMEILEACGGDRVHIDMLTEVLAEGLQELGPEPDRPQPLDEMERRLLCAISTITSALRNLAWFLAEQHKRSRTRRMIEQLPERVQRLIEEAFLRRVEMMPKKEAGELIVESTQWAYVIWSPAEQVAMFRLLELAADGKYISKSDRERAREFLDRYRASMPMGRRSTGGNGGGAER